MASKIVLAIAVNDDGATVASQCATGVGGSPRTNGIGSVETIRDICRYLESQADQGVGICVRYADTAVSASTTGTFTGAPTAAQTITVNGVAFTARASGAVEDEFNIGDDVTETAANLAAAINASTTAGILNTVGATSSSGVVTFYSVVPGPVGKNIPITESLDNFTLANTTFSTGGTQSNSTTLIAGLTSEGN